MTPHDRSIAYLVGRWIAFVAVAGSIVGAGALLAIFVALALGVGS